MDQPAPIKTSTSIFGQNSQTSSVHLPSDKPTGHNSHIEPPKDERGKQENQIPQDVESNVSPFKLPQEIHSGQLSKRQLAKVQNIKMPMIAEENSRPSFPDIDSG
ncbi:hypothetical protein IFR05_011307 [Cadophora sp. M221]|nr:hypothetical protein IFR05_011307 [Cadophora sp. M221]